MNNQSNRFTMIRVITQIVGSSSFAVRGFFIYMVLLSLFWSDFNFIVLVLFTFTSSREIDKQTRHNVLKSEFPLLGFLVLYGVSILLSLSDSNTLGVYSTWPTALLIYFVASNYFDFKTDWRLFCYSFCIYSIIVSINYMFAYIGSPLDSVTDIITEVKSPLYIVPNDLLFLALISPFCFSLFLSSSAIIDKLLSATSIILGLFTLVAFETRSAVLIYVICGCVFTFLYSPRNVRKILCYLGVFVVVFDLILGFPLTTKLTMIPSSRVPLWYAASSMFIENPLFGNGPQSFAAYYTEFIATISFPTWVVVDERNIPWPHNLFLEILAGSGIFCLISFLGFLAYKFQSLLDISKSEKVDPLIPVCLLSVFVGFIFAALIEMTFLRIWVLILLFSFLGFINNICRNIRD